MPLLSYHSELTLRRSLDDIEKRSQVLLGKGKMARTLDKVQDTLAVIVRADLKGHSDESSRRAGLG